MAATSNGGAAKRVKVIDAADLKANGGSYSLEQRAPVRVYGVTDAETKAQGGAYAVEGNIAMPVYVVGTAAPVEGTVAPLPMIGVLGALAAGNVAMPVIVVGGVLGLVPPLAPTNLTAVPTGTNNLHVLLDWDAPADTDEYDIEYSTDGVSYAPLTTVTAPTTAYTHTTPTWGIVTHSYRVRGVNAAGEGAWADVTIADLLLGLVAGWSMNAASGDEANLVTGGGTLVDTNTVGSAAGKLAGARDFVNANSEYFSLADNAAVSLGAGVRFTFAVWVYYAAVTAAARGILGKRTGATTSNIEYFLRVFTSKVRLAVSPTGTTTGLVEVSSADSVATAAWSLVYGWYDGATLSVAIGNGAATTAAFSADGFNGAAAFTLGAGQNAGEYWDGRIDQPLIYKRVLSATNRAQLWNGGAGKAYPF